MVFAVKILLISVAWQGVVWALERKPHPCPITPREDGHRAGHLEQLGCQRPPLGPITEYSDPPSPRELWENHVKPYKPAVIRNALKGSPAVTKWASDEYLASEYGDQEVLIERKYEDRKSTPKRMMIKEFLENYQEYNWYVVSMLPNAMRKDIRVPRPLMCSTFRKNLAELNLWIGTNGTRSMLHYDADNIMHCVVTGLKDWILIHPENKPKLDMVLNRDGQMSGFSHLNVDSIDEDVNPEVWDVAWQYVTLRDGDCLYLPYQYLHQVRSYNRTVSSTFLFYPDSNFNDDDCASVNLDDYLNLKDTYVYWTYEKGQETVDMGYMNPQTVREEIMEVMRVIGKPKISKRGFLYLMFVQHGIETDGDEIETFFVDLDANSDGYVTRKEIKNADIEILKRYCRAADSPHGPTKSQAPRNKKLNANSPEFKPRNSDRHIDSRFASIFLDFVIRVKGENGGITYPNFKKFVEVDNGSVADAFVYFDKNFDGILTKEELQNATRKRLREFSRMRYAIKGTTIRGGGIYEHEVGENDMTYLKDLNEIPEEKTLTSEQDDNEPNESQELVIDLKEFFSGLREILADGDTLDEKIVRSVIESSELSDERKSFDFKTFFDFIDRGNKGYISLEDVEYYAENAEIDVIEKAKQSLEYIKPREFLAEVIQAMDMVRDFDDEAQNRKEDKDENKRPAKTEL